MNNTEKTLIELKEQRNQIINNQNVIRKIKVKMSDLRTNRNVALYAHSLEEMIHGDELHSHLYLIEGLKKDQNVQEYILLSNTLKELEKQKEIYYKKIQKQLKHCLNQESNQDIYVYYGIDNDNNIITRNILNSDLSNLKENTIAILPKEKYKSKRKIRHFYNKTRFKYLEEIVKTNSK